MKNTTIRHLPLFAFAAAIVSVGACSKEEDEAQKVSIAWISKGKCNSFFDLSRAGVGFAEDDLNSAGSAEVTVSMMEPENCDAPPVTSDDPCAKVQKQIESMEQAIAANVNGIAISVADPACVGPLIDEAVDAGIKVVTFDSDAPDSKRSTYWGIDNYKASKQAAELLMQLIGGKGKVIVQTAMTGSEADGFKLSTSKTYVDRIQAFEDVAGDNPDVEVAEYVPCIGSEPSDPACAETIEAAIAANPDVKGIYFARGKILRELELATNAPLLTAARKDGTIKVVAFDAPTDALENLQAGYADATVNQKLFGWGYDTITLLFDMLTAGRSVESFTDSEWDVICDNNMKEYADKIKAQDFRTPLSQCEL